MTRTHKKGLAWHQFGLAILTAVTLFILILLLYEKLPALFKGTTSTVSCGNPLIGNGTCTNKTNCTNGIAYETAPCTDKGTVCCIPASAPQQKTAAKNPPPSPQNKNASKATP
ncbi:hypothetical protein D6783_05070 [Candidatus Woesearchaeota archaeon]|nr:MAG: hypothetical protein D6783_05070 [Candidatus Woesearchaeota archaeon]